MKVRVYFHTILNDIAFREFDSNLLDEPGITAFQKFCSKLLQYGVYTDDGMTWIRPNTIISAQLL